MISNRDHRGTLTNEARLQRVVASATNSYLAKSTFCAYTKEGKGITCFVQETCCVNTTTILYVKHIAECQCQTLND